MHTTKTATAKTSFDERAVEEQLLERCASLSERAVRAGADEAETFGTRSRTIAVRFEKGDLKLAQVDDQTSLGLRAFRERRLGFSATNQSDDRALATTASDVLTLCKFSPPDEFNVLPGARTLERRPTLVEHQLAATTIERAVELGRAFLDRAKRVDRRLSIDNALCELSRVTQAIHSTRGVHAAESDAQLGLSIFGMAIDGEDVGGFHYDGDNLRKLADVEPAIETLVRDFSSVALENLGAARAETYTGPVLFSPDALLAVLISPLVSASSAIAVQRGRSPLADKVGQVIASAALDVYDDATDRTLAGAGDFDREGQPTGRLALVRKGVLETHLFNGYAAAVAGRASTGHARGGPRSTPGLGAHALVVGAGHGGDREQMLRTLGRGLFVQRFSGTVDPASGDFSGVAKSARWVEHGACVRPLKETLLSGNAFALLKQILALSSHGERIMGSARAPYAIVDGIAVTAG